MEMRSTYTVNKVTFSYKEPTCRDRLKLSADKEILTMQSLPYEKIIDLLGVKMIVDDKEYNLDTLPNQYFKELFKFANMIVVKTLQDFTAQEDEAKKSE